MRIAPTFTQAGQPDNHGLDSVSLQMSDCAGTLYNDLKEVLHHLGGYTTNICNLLGLVELNQSTRVKLEKFLTRHRVLENFLHQLLQEVWKFSSTLKQTARKNDLGTLLLYESRLNGFYQDTGILESGLARFEFDYNLFMEELQVNEEVN
jgi:hypothetical protein